MANEIERKFLVKDDSWRQLARPTRYRQGYLSTARERTVRVRTVDDRGYLTIKGLAVGLSRPEYEYEIPGSEADEMLTNLCEKPLIEKNRYKISCGSLTWEVDEFLGDNQGLVVAEIELPAADHALELPEWVGAEVSDDHRYCNSNLVKNPFTRW